MVCTRDVDFHCALNYLQYLPGFDKEGAILSSTPIVKDQVTNVAASAITKSFAVQI